MSQQTQSKNTQTQQHITCPHLLEQNETVKSLNLTLTKQLSNYRDRCVHLSRQIGVGKTRYHSYNLISIVCCKVITASQICN